MMEDDARPRGAGTLCLAFAAALLAWMPATSLAGPYTEPGHDKSTMNAWAFEVVELVRGPLDIDDVGLGFASFGVEDDVLGPASGPLTLFDVVSLGDGGSIVLGFEEAIHDGAGDDFAVFENGFWNEFGLFVELAYVEVSTDGVSFARFDAISLRDTSVLAFEELDPTDFFNLAGKHETGVGTGFDLAQLAGHPLVTSGEVDLDEIYYVRIVDVVGNGSTFDSLGEKIYDPYSTPFPEGGFDLDGVGAIHVPEPSQALSLGTGWLGLLALGRLRRPSPPRRNPARDR